MTNYSLISEIFHKAHILTNETFHKAKNLFDSLQLN